VGIFLLVPALIVGFESVHVRDPVAIAGHVAGRSCANETCMFSNPEWWLLGLFVLAAAGTLAIIGACRHSYARPKDHFQ
jgi:hypothetical protein